MGFSSAWHWIIVLLVVLIVFGAGRLPRVMGDVAKGIKTFKAGLKDEDEPVTPTTTTTASADYRAPEYKGEVRDTRPETLSPRQPI